MGHTLRNGLTLTWPLVTSLFAELYCPNGQTDYNANWPNSTVAGDYVSGQYCFGGWSGFIGRQCSITGAWVNPPNGTCTRKDWHTHAYVRKQHQFGRVADMHAVSPHAQKSFARPATRAPSMATRHGLSPRLEPRPRM